MASLKKVKNIRQYVFSGRTAPHGKSHIALAENHAQDGCNYYDLRNN